MLICKGSSSACQHTMLSRYLQVTGQDVHSDMYLFRLVNRSKDKAKLLSSNKPISYTRARECIVGKLKLVAPNLNLGTHSLRVSGVSMVANAEDNDDINERCNAEDNDDINERCLMRHGRWKSTLSKDGYVNDSVEKRLSVTKKLKL